MLGMFEVAGECNNMSVLTVHYGFGFAIMCTICMCLLCCSFVIFDLKSCSVATTPAWLQCDFR